MRNRANSSSSGTSPISCRPTGRTMIWHGTSAALEFGVMGLEVEHIVMLGHAGCGGVGAFARGEANAGYQPLSPGEFVGKWISLIQPAAARNRAGWRAPRRLHRASRLGFDRPRSRQFAHLSLDRGARTARQARPSRSLFRDLRGLFCLRSTRLSGRFEPVAAGAHRAAFARPGS